MIKKIFVFSMICSVSVASLAQSNRKRTVEELLKQAGRGSELKAAEKNKAKLPTFNEKIISDSRRNPIDLNKVKPPRTSLFMEEGDDDKAKLEKITDQQIQELFKLTQKYKTSERRGELWLRLAELYVEKAGVIDFRKQTEYDTKLRDFHEGRSKIKPSLDLRDAKDFNRKAIQLYEWFVRDFPKDEKIDQALFFLGYNHFEVGDLKKGLHYYTRLTKEFPRSSFITESHFALGEYYFENEKWKQALENYSQILKYKKHRLYTFSSYKAAWCHYRSGNTKYALQMMEKLIRENRDDVQVAVDGKKSVSKARLEKEGLRDIVLFYGEAGDPKRAIEYFRSIAGQDANSYVEKLAYLYVDVGNREAGRSLFNYLVSENPTNPKAFDYKFQIIKAYSNATKTREFREELYSWVHNFASGGSWYEANQANTSLIENANKHRELTLKNWILTQHQTAQNTKAKFSQSLAHDGYQVFLKEFPNSTSIPDIHFYFAELLYDMDKYDEAGVHYRWVVENAPNSKYGIEAAKNIVITFEKNLPKDSEIARTVGKSIDPVPFSPKVENFLSAAKWYLEKFENTPKAAEVKFRVGRLHYQHNQFDEAEKLFREIIQKHSKTKYAEYSANLLLDIYSLKKDYAGLEKAGKELLSVPSISESAAGKDIKGVLEKSQFKKAQDLELEKNYQASAEEYEKFAQQNPKSDLSTAAIFNAAINFERAGLNQKAMGYHQATLASNNKTAEPLKIKSRRILAKLYQDSGQLEEAAKLFHAAGVEAGKDPLAMNYFNNAAVIYEALGQHKEALANYSEYYELNKKADRYEILFQVAQIHRKLGQKTQAAEQFQEFLNHTELSEKSIEASYWIYNYYSSMNKQKDAEKWKQKTISMQRKLSPQKAGPGAQWVAKILVSDINVEYQEFVNSKISSDPNKQKKTLDKKISLLSEFNKKLAEIIKFNSADEIVSSLVILGKANLHMGDSILEVPLPKGLNPQEVKMYKEGIQKVADPFLSKAKESYRAAYERAQELEAYTQEYLNAREVLTRLDPQFISDHNELPADFRQGTWISQ